MIKKLSLSLLRKVFLGSSLTLMGIGAFAQVPCGNLFPEGSFENSTCSSPGTYFAHGSGYSCQTTCCSTNGTYMFTSNATQFNQKFLGTPRTGNKMMVVDMRTSGGDIIKTKEIYIQPNTTYTFTAYVKNAVCWGLPDFPSIKLKVMPMDNSQTYPEVTVAASPTLPELGPWVKVQGTWTSPCTLTPNYHVHLIVYGDPNGGNGGDLLIDDVSFDACPAVAPAMPTAPNCVTRCGPGSLTLTASGACAYKWYTVPAGGTPVSTSNQYTPNIATLNTFKYYYVAAVNSQGVESPRKTITAITDPIRTWVTSTSPALCAGDIGSYTIHVQNLDCTSSHNLSVSYNVTGQGNYSQVYGPALGNVTIPAGQTVSYNVGGTFSSPGNYTFKTFITDFGNNCQINNEHPIKVSNGNFTIEGYVDGVCTEDMIFVGPLEPTTSNTFDILDENGAVVNSCNSTNSFCSMTAPATPGVYTVRNTAIIGNCTKVTTLPLHVFGKNRNFYFDGKDDRITAPDNPAYNVLDKDFTLEAWVTIDPGVEKESALISKGDWQDTGFIFSIGEKGVTLELTIQGQTTQSSMFKSSIYDGKCHHVAVSRNGSDVVFYLDGVIVGKGSNTGIIDNSEMLVMGFDEMRRINPLYGRLDEVRFWQIYRSEDEINSAKNLRSPNNFDKLIGFWPLNERSSQILMDYSLVDNDATLGYNSSIEAVDPKVTEDVCLKYCPESQYRVSLSGSNTSTHSPTNVADKSDFEVTLAPNPFSNQSSLQVKSHKFDSFNLSILTIEGKKILSKQVAANSFISLGENLKPGLYVLHINTPDGIKIIKLIKQ
ncbi:LamG-like jellyroll fold domain-containing protein [Adhaeribacter soli]|uniref:T9SS type A sorting domain-containing protein n=1 Tax=Adhaeribacter soli TaxID=2607655 RepID=A0A5N1IMC3_9BACT|nr:LamG-like jellyroll fold domain-containing protein [Adhaeribacter soli]KAA9327305.1 T9SS type A sorting domain-containing protein [Adhaeribacter soli]